jgi:thioredoxin reductase/Pyruvate/2-oxoacid:ferredoxin oxidoreductase delta subunit
MTSTKTPAYFATVPSNEILPIVDGNYESSVKGIFVVGDVTGLPLVKVAANQGAEVMEAMGRGGFERGSVEDSVLDLVIVGGGPAGISAALEAQKRGLRFVLLERSQLASTIHGFPPGKKVYAEPRYLKNDSALPMSGDLAKDAFLRMVGNTVQEANLPAREGVECTGIRKNPEGYFEVECAGGESFRGLRIVLAVGRQGQPRLLDMPGADQEDKVHYRFHTAEDYSDQDLLVVGGGNSAVEAALMLAAGNRVTLAYRREEFFRLKPDNKKHIEAAMAKKKLTVLFNTTPLDIGTDSVTLEVAGEERRIPNDHVLALLGSLPPIPFLMKVGLELDGVWTKKRVAWCLFGLFLGYLVYFQAKHFVLLPEAAGLGQHYVPGFSWLFNVVPTYFSNLYGFYYLVYFSLIAFFGIYWARRYKHRIVWRRNLTLIFSQWTLWWGLPTFLAVFAGRNAWTPLLQKSLNAWPLNMGAFDVAPLVRMGDPPWWHAVALVGVVWAALLTFVVLPLFTVLVGKHYCSHVCSCGALAETVGNAFRHRAPKGDGPRRWERMGFVFIVLASVATGADVLGVSVFLEWYNLWVGTLLAGALAIGCYPFLGQRVWCRFWCPLAFWMNFWGRWSRFKISPEPGKCIDCNVCNQYCQMGIDIRTRALQGKPVTLKDTPCVACGECVVRCPMEILHLGDAPVDKGASDGATPRNAVSKPVHDTLDIPKMNEISERHREG